MNTDLTSSVLQRYLAEADFIDCTRQCLNVPGPWIKRYAPSERTRACTAEVVIHCSAEDLIIVELVPRNAASLSTGPGQGGAQ